MTRPDRIAGLHELYDIADPQVSAVAVKVNTTCTGCTDAHCCEYLALCTTIEAADIALLLTSKPDWRTIVPELVSNALRCDFEGLNEREYQLRRIPCPFLRPVGAGLKRCGIYSHRPGPCRYLYSLDSPDSCSAAATASKTNGSHRALDTVAVQQYIAEVSQEFCDDVKLVNMVAPISIMVLSMMHAIVFDPGQPFSAEDREYLHKSVKNVTHPLAWMQKHAQRLSEAAEKRNADPNFRIKIPAF